MKFIELHSYDGDLVVVNFDQVCEMYPDRRENVPTETILNFGNEKINVRETMGEIFKKLESSKSA